MKAIRQILAVAAALAVAALAGCSKEEGVSPDSEAGYAASASISSGSSYFTATGGGGAIAFKSAGGIVRVFVDCGTDWYAENNAADIFAAEADISSGMLTVTAGENRLSQELSGVITLRTSASGIQFAVIEVTQNAYGAPEITVGAAEWRFPAFGDGLSAEIEVSSSLGDYDVANSDGRWLTVAKTDAGISLVAAENGSKAERTATVTLTADDGRRSDEVEIIVTQDGVAYITLGEDEVAASASGDVVAVDAESNFDIEWEIDKDAAWVAVEASGPQLILTVAANETGEDRETVISLTAGDGAQNNAEALLTVTQKADNPDSFILEYSIQTAGQKITLPLSGTVDCTVDWGDGTVQYYNYTFPSHTFQEGRIFDVTVTGTVTALSCNSLDDLSKTLLTNVIQWGNTGLVDMSYAFYQTNVRYLPADTRGAFADVTTMELAFRYCASLTEVSEDLLAYGSKITSIRSMFDKCTSLSVVPEGLLRNCTNITTAYNAFSEIAWTEVPAKLFENCTKITNMAFVFSGCTQLTSLPEDLFSYCPNVSTFNAAFQSCTFKSIPAGLFKNNTKANDFTFTFYGCWGITEIPSGLFDSCTSATSFYCTFYNCANLETVPDGLFDNCRNVLSFNSTFMYCYKLKAIPEGLFKNNTNVTDVGDCFWHCDVVESVPQGLFDAFTSVTDFGGVFCYCANLADVPEDLFKNCTKALNFQYAFNQCWALKSLPSMAACTNAEVFNNAFSACTSITEIPEGFFAGCTSATAFSNTFASDSKLASVPADLFSACSNATAFNGVFSSCSSLTEIPDGLFDNCVSATTFSGAFNGCSGITAVQEDIFASCPKVTDFSYVFGGTGLTTVPAGLFDNCTAVTDFYVSFNGCTALSGESPYTEIDGVKVHLYERKNYPGRFTAPSSYDYCFTGCDGLTDLDEIKDAGWY